MIPTLSPAAPTLRAPTPPPAATGTEAVEAAAPAAAGVSVSISEQGRQAARGGPGAKTAAAGGSAAGPGEEAPALPRGVREALARLREIRQRLEEASAELQRVMNDRRMAPEVREARVTALRTEIATLHGALRLASQALLEAMKTAALDMEQSSAVLAAL